MPCLAYLLFLISSVAAQTCQPNGIVTVVGTEGTTTEVPCPEYTTGNNELFTCTNGQWVARGRCVSNVPTNFNYTVSNFVLMINQTITAITPTVNCYNCEFLLKDHDQGATLPAGISLDPATGTLSGTPTEIQERQTYTIVARVRRGDAEFEVAFTVLGDKECLPNDIISVGGFEGTSVTVPCPEHTTGINEVYICKNGQWIAQGICTYPAPTNFSYALSDFVLEVGQRMTAITPTVVCYNCEFVLKDRLLGTVLPTGIFLDYVTGTLSGTPTEMQERQTYTIIARTPSGNAECEVAFTVLDSNANLTLIIIIIACVVVILVIVVILIVCTNNKRKKRQSNLKTVRTKL